MNSLRRWLYRPKRSDQSLLAQFYFADEELNHVAAELDSFEGRGDPERCATLVNQLRACQARVLNVVSQMMDESIKDQRALRDFRVKFPDDLCQENLAGQLWFGAECLAAGSSIMNKEVESACMRPLARALTKNLESLRTILREQCLQNVNEYTELITESLIIFDKLFAEFELSYVSAMAPVKTAHEYDMIQEITVLFSETVHRALKIGLLSQDMIDEYDPALMFTIPRLAIVCGTLIFKDGPLNPDNEPRNISEMFRPFQTLLHKIRELLTILTGEELNTLERALCSQDEPSFLVSLEESRKQAREERRRHKKGKKSVEKIKKRVEVQEEDNGSIESELTAREIAERLEALALNFEASRINTELGARGRADENPPVEVQCQNGEGSLSSSPLCCSVTDGACHAAPSNSSELGEDNRSCVDQNMNVAQKENSQDSTSAFVENLVNNIPDSSSADQVTTESDVHALLTTDAKCENNGTLKEVDNDDVDDDDRSISKDCAAHPDDFGRYELNKCDSNDSGLHSEVMSNSGSMFTISSSDSNQQITTSESVSHLPEQTGKDGIEMGDTAASSESESYNHGTACGNHPDSDFGQPLAVQEFDGQPEKNLCGSDENNSQYIDSNKTENRDVEILTPLSSHTNTAVQVTSDSVASSPVSPVKCPHQESDNAVVNGSAEDECADNLPGVGLGTGMVVESEHDVSDSHACAFQTSSQEGGEPNHSSDNSSMPKYVCDINFLDVDLCAKNCEAVGDSLSEASNTYQKSGTNVTCSETDSNSDARSLSLTDDHHFQLDLNGVNEEETHVNTFSAPSLLQTSAETGLVSNNTFPFSSENSSHQRGVSNGHTDNSSSTQFGKSQTSNSVPSSTISESAENTASAQSSTLASSSHTQIKKSSKNGRHRRNKEPRGNRSDFQSRHSRDKKPKLCAAHSKMLLQASQLDSDCYNSSETSSYTSDCGDQEEIALAIEAAENASRNNVRARFKSNSDMIHRLFVCISGVADQLQTNFAGDLRNILRSVFDMNCSEPADKSDTDKPKDSTPLGAAYRAMSHAARASRHRHSSLRRQDPPVWLADEDCNECMACQVPFTFVRRRHHCRNCGKIFCGRCSSSYVPLPQFGQEKAVRVCNGCFMFQVTPFH